MKVPEPRQLPSGKYLIEVMVSGKRMSKTFPTPEQAKAWAAAVKTDLLQISAEEEQQRRGNITLTKAIDRYLADRENIISPSTYKGYKEVQRNRLQSLMPMVVSKITTADVQRAINEDAKRLRTKSIKNALRVVLPVIEEYHQNINVHRLRLPQQYKEEHAYLQVEDMIKLFTAIQGDLCELPILMATWLCMRRSEIFGLCWDCVDFENNSIIIKRTYVVDKEKGYILREATKTVGSRRILEDCPGYIMDKLKAYPRTAGTDRIFTMSPNTPYRNLEKICAKNDITFPGFHGLRHTNASVMASLKIIDVVAMSIGGWSTDVTMKKVYEHVFSADKKSAVNSINSYFQSVLAGKIPEITSEITNSKTEPLEPQRS